MCVCVVVQIYHWAKFYFALYLTVIVYDTELKQWDIKFKRRIQLIYNMYVSQDLNILQKHMSKIMTPPVNPGSPRNF